jgi:hypothetical protein
MLQNAESRNTLLAADKRRYTQILEHLNRRDAERNRIEIEPPGRQTRQDFSLGLSYTYRRKSAARNTKQNTKSGFHFVSVFICVYLRLKGVLLGSRITGHGFGAVTDEDHPTRSPHPPRA